MNVFYLCPKVNVCVLEHFCVVAELCFGRTESLLQKTSIWGGN